MKIKNSGKRKKVFLVAPSFFIEKTDISRSISLLKEHFEVFHRKDIFSKYYSFAGSDERREYELNDAITSDADIIWALRGGYGANRIIEKVNFRTLKKKIFIGFSDFTPVLYYAHLNGHRSIYAPMLNTFSNQKYSVNTVIGMLDENRTRSYKIAQCREFEGFAYPFCLKLLISMIGTKLQPDLKKDHVLFIEDVKEKEYALDRDITQLYLSGIIKDVRSVFFNFTNIDKAAPIDLKKHTEGLFTEKNLCWDLKFGHSRKFIPIIFGERTVIKNEKIYFFDDLNI